MAETETVDQSWRDQPSKSLMTLFGKPKRMETGVVSCSIASNFESTNSQSANEANLLASSGFPAAGVAITLGTVDDKACGTVDSPPTLTGYL
jgi:hypothetical protein